MTKTVTFQLNWEPNGFQAPYFLAREKGYYDAEGLDVQFVEGQGSLYAAEQTACGRADFGLAGGSAVLAVQSEGFDPLAVAAVTQKTPATIYTLTDVFDGSLNHPAQLFGTRIAPSATKIRILTAQLLAETGIEDEVELLPVDPNTHHRVQHQLLDGEVDAAVGVVTNGTELMWEYNRVAHELPIGKYLDIYGMTLVTNSEMSTERPAVVRSFLRATARGWAAATNDPDVAVDALVARNATLERRRDIERLKFKTAAFDLQLTDHVQTAGWGNQDADRWRTLSDTLAETDLLDGTVDPDTAWTNEFLDTDVDIIEQYTERIDSTTP